MTWCSTPSERARSAGAGGCWNRAGCTCLRTWASFPRHDQAMMNDFKDLMESGLFRPVIDRSYPLAEIVEAYRYVETGQRSETW